MRYVVVSDYELRGGAAIAAGRLASALVARGHDVSWVTAHPDGATHAWRTLTPKAQGAERVLRGLLARAPRALQPRLSGPRWHEQVVEKPLRRLLESLEPDVVNLHNVHSAHWQPSVLDAVPSRARALWTLHDMWSTTGRCAYAYDCRKFITGCDDGCPTPREYPALEPALIAPAWLRRAEVLRRRPDAIAVAPSRWLASEAKAGLWRGHDVARIPNGVPSDAYVPIERGMARDALGIGRDERVMAVMAENLTDRRKGWSYLAGALEALRALRFRVVLIGSNGAAASVPAPHVALAVGHVAHPRMQSLSLSAADCFVHPAPVDNLPNVVLEALACGLPTVAFPIGGLPDMVRPGVTGWLAEEVSAASLAAALERAATDGTAGAMAESCRRVATTDYAMDLQARRYEALIAGDRADML